MAEFYTRPPGIKPGIFHLLNLALHCGSYSNALVSALNQVYNDTGGNTAGGLPPVPPTAVRQLVLQDHVAVSQGRVAAAQRRLDAVVDLSRHHIRRDGKRVHSHDTDTVLLSVGRRSEVRGHSDGSQRCL